MRNRILSVLAFSLLAADYAAAASVTLESTWGFGPRRQTLEQLVFTFDDATPDSNPSPATGTYVGAFSAVEFTYDNVLWTFDSQGTRNRIQLRTDNSITMNTFSFEVSVVNAQGEHRTLSAGVEASPYFKHDTLTSLPDDLHANYGQIYLFTQSPNDPDLVLGDLRGNAVFTRVSSVPLPGSLLLLGSGLTALLTARRGGRTRRNHVLC
jgi:hypothetical protein